MTFKWYSKLSWSSLSNPSTNTFVLHKWISSPNSSVINKLLWMTSIELMTTRIWPRNDSEMTDYQYDLWELDKLSRKANRCDPNRCSIWKRFLFRQDWNWPWMTERHVTVMWGQMRLCSINPRWQITILIKARYRSFAAQKGTLFIFIIKTTCFEAWTWTRTCPGHVRTFGLPRVGS